MFKRLVLISLAAVLLLSIVGCDGDPEPGEPTGEATLESSGTTTDELLTPADVEKVSGLSGLVVVPADPAIGAGGDINISDGKGQLVVMLVDEGPETWDAWLTDGFTVAQTYSPPIGDESFVGPNPDVSTTQYIFGFRKGDRAIAIDTYFVNGQTTTVLTIDELRELATIVESRL